MLLDVHRGFMTGDLRPLRTYLTAGYPLDAALRTMLVEAIDGKAGEGLFTLNLNQNGRGSGRDVISKRRQRRKEWEIAQYVEERIPLYRKTPVKQATDDAMTKFGVSRTVVTTARTKFKKTKSS